MSAGVGAGAGLGAQGATGNAQGVGAIDFSQFSARDMARFMDSTILKAETTPEQVEALVCEAVQLGCAAVCVSPSMVAGAATALHRASTAQTEHDHVAHVVPAQERAEQDNTAHDTTTRNNPAHEHTAQAHIPRIATVAGFPSGKHTSLIKAAEARFAVEQGAEEVDVVIDLAAALAGDKNALISELVTIREAIPAPVVLKVIVESALLNEEQLCIATQACALSGADYVKTSTGFHAAGGASVRAVEIMAEELRTLGVCAPLGLAEELRQQRGLIGIKASGGIRDWDSAVAMLRAGATRLGVSAARAILDSRPECSA